MSASVRNLLKTTPGDKKHFPATNQAHFCHLQYVINHVLILYRQKYNEFVLCMKRSEGDEEKCGDARMLAVQICPEDWVSCDETEMSCNLSTPADFILQFIMHRNLAHLYFADYGLS